MYDYDILSESDKNKMRKLNAQNQYCLTANVLKTLRNRHEKAQSEGDTYTMALIEYRLTDINFHTECSHMARCEYAEIDEIIKNW